MKKLLVLAIVLSLASCSELNKVLQSIPNDSKNVTLSQSDIVKGLKEALTVGTDTAVLKLSSLNGYYYDNLVKILLPKEADVIINNINKIPGGDKLVEKVILGINRSAEDASKEAAPIFKASITSITFNDALGILNGSDNAATEYLKKSTYDQLVGLYQPKIKTSVNKKLVSNVSTASAWNDLTGAWNKFANSAIGKASGYKPVNINLEDYLTQKALDGLFIKIAEQEKKIRQDPVARVTEILRKVFK